MVARFQYAMILTDQFLATITGDSTKGRIDVDDIAFGIGNADTFMRFAEYSCRKLESVFGTFTLGNVG
jgi:hypothetical protein